MVNPMRFISSIDRCSLSKKGDNSCFLCITSLGEVDMGNIQPEHECASLRNVLIPLPAR